MARLRSEANAALKQSEQWGVPKWKDTEGYPTKSTNQDLWKWEFLRRTDEYRNDWDQIHDKKRLARKYNLLQPLPPQKSFIDLHDHNYFFRIPDSPTGGVVVYPIPSVPNLTQARNQKKNSKQIISRNDLIKYALDMKPSPPRDWYDMRVWVEYDLGHALKPQLNLAEDALGKMQKQINNLMAHLGRPCDPDDYCALPVGTKKQRGTDKKKNTKEMEKLLRIMDAKRINIGNTTIARGLVALNFKHMDDSTVSKSYKAALKLWKEL